MKNLEPPPSTWPMRERRRRPTDAESEYQRQVRRFFRFLKIVLACILVVVVVTAWWVRGAARSAADSAREAKLSAKSAEDASKVNTGLLDRYKPCLPEDGADTPQCQRATVISEAIAAIQSQYAEQNQKVDELLAKAEALLSRPVAQRTTVVRETAPVRSGAGSGTAGADTPAVPSEATQPAPTAPACDQRGKSGRCR